LSLIEKLIIITFQIIDVEILCRDCYDNRDFITHKNTMKVVVGRIGEEGAELTWLAFILNSLRTLAPTQQRSLINSNY